MTAGGEHCPSALAGCNRIAPTAADKRISPQTTLPRHGLGASRVAQYGCKISTSYVAGATPSAERPGATTLHRLTARADYTDSPTGVRYVGRKSDRMNTAQFGCTQLETAEAILAQCPVNHSPTNNQHQGEVGSRYSTSTHGGRQNVVLTSQNSTKIA